jgi:hypothetical protein
MNGGGFYTYQMMYINPGYYTQTNSASVSCSGSVHFKFTWVAPNGEKAPKQVITNKSASASWSAPAVNGGGSCSTSLGGPTQSWVNGGSVSDQTYTVMDSSSGLVEFDIALSASAYGSSTMTAPNSSGNVVASVNCDANVTSVRVLLGGFQHDPVPLGTTPWQCLTGDTITANLDTGTYPQLLGSHNWTETGPSFKDFYLTANDETGKRRYIGEGQDPPPALPERKRTSFTLRYYDKGTSVITCTAQILTPKGTFLTVTGDSETITIVRPTWTWAVLDGEVRIVGGLITATGAAAPGGSPRGQDWTAEAKVPAPFLSRAAELRFSQNILSNRFQWANRAAPENLWGDVDNGIWSLDNSFPYGSITSTTPVPGTFRINTGDSPGVSLPGNLDFYEVQGKDDFETWLIFRPSGGEWVSLAKDTWGWYGRCKRNAMNNWYIAYPTTLSHTVPVDTTAHPSWTHKTLNQALVPIGT